MKYETKGLRGTRNTEKKIEIALGKEISSYKESIESVTAHFSQVVNLVTVCAFIVRIDTKEKKEILKLKD